MKVGDFGLSISTLARDVRHDLGTTGFQGTPQFAPPEQLRGEPLDVRADIYAVGATLYYLLTGRPPFDARDLGDLFARVASEVPTSPRLLRPETPRGLASVVLQCLTKTPTDRPVSYAALAEALRPFAAVDDAPARPGVRVLAGILDSLIVALPVAGWQAWSGASVTQAAATTATVAMWIWIVPFAYYCCLEGWWGASLGKRLLGLRVTSGVDRASWPRIARRTAVFYLPNLLVALAVLITRSAGIDVPVAIVTAVPLLTAALFLTARRHNGWAALHDLASGTCVISRLVAGARRIGVLPADGPVPEGVVPQPAERRYGPFTVVSDAGDTGHGRLLLGFDPVLRRRVWIHAVPPHRPATSAARRDVGRVGRLYWLTGRRSLDENWDAFEAPGGVPLLTRPSPWPGWPTLKLWLLDLSSELAASALDRSMPVLGLERIWVRSDGRLVLLDFPAPGVGPTSGRLGDLGPRTPVSLMSAVATRGLPAGGSRQEAPLSMPLSARALLDGWSGPSPPAIDHARKALLGVAATPDRVSRWRRAVPIALASGPVVSLLVSALLLLPSLSRFVDSQEMEALRWLDRLRQSVLPAESRLGDPEIRDAVERFVSGRYGALLDGDRFWSGPVTRQVGSAELRRIAEDITARHPSVSAEELDRVSAIIAPEIERAEQWAMSQASDQADGAGIIVMAMTAAAMGFVLCCSVVSSAIVPGGAATLLLGLAVVTRDGTEIGRWRSLARVLLAWLPGIAWLAYLAAAPRIQGFVPVPASPMLSTGLALGALAMGASWAIAQPTRGLHDRLAGTWIVPR